MYFKRIVLTLILAAVPFLFQDQQVISLQINEICPSNIDQWVDSSFNYGGWVELYNPTSTTVNITGWYLSDNKDKLQKAKIMQETTVPAYGFKTLWFDHYSKWSKKTIDMKLDCDGGTIYLSDSQGKLFASLDYPEAVSRCSWARTAECDETWIYCANPTPGKNNVGSKFACERLEEPEIDTSSQVFASEDITLNVIIPEGCTLRYTTDGSAPTETNGYTSQTGVFSTSFNRTFRFRLFRDGYLPSPVVSRTFIKRSYDIDLPILSITGTMENFYGDSLGIFVKGVNGRAGNGQSSKCNYNMDWERPSVFDYFTADGELLYEQETDIERCGGWSRAWAPASFKIKANKRYEGKSHLLYSFFDEKPYLKHKTLQVRNGGNDNNCRIKDVILQQIVATSGIDIDYQAYQPVAHYINGVWKGVINLREPNNKHFVYSNYGYDDDEIDQFEMSPDSGYCQKCGTYDAMQDLLTLSKSASDANTYKAICNLLDMDEFCNYMAIEFYLRNSDWPQNNIKAWRPRCNDGRFRFLLYDLDKVDMSRSPFTDFNNKRFYTFNRLFGESMQNITKEIEIVTIFLNLLNNDTFRKKFIDTFCLVTYSVFEPSRCAEICDRVANRVAHTQSLYNNESPWDSANKLRKALSSSRQTTLMNLLKDFSRMKLWSRSTRKAKLQANIPEARLSFNGMPIPTDKFNGQYYPPLTVKAEAPSGYTFMGWCITSRTSDGQCASVGMLVSSNPEYTLYEESCDLIACFEPIATNSNPLPPVVINEVSADNGIYVNDLWKKSDWIELHNTTDQDIDLTGMYLSDKVNKADKWQIGSDLADDAPISTIIPAHGYRIIWCDKEEGIRDLHAPFKLKNEDKNRVILTAADGSWGDTLTYCAHRPVETVGRYPDASQNIYLLTRTTIERTNRITTIAAPVVLPANEAK